MEQYKISKHAFDRFSERSCGEFKIKTIEKAMLNLLGASRPILPTKKFQEYSMLNNKFRNAKYRYSQGYIFVILNDTVVTVYKNIESKFTWFNGKRIKALKLK